MIFFPPLPASTSTPSKSDTTPLAANSPALAGKECYLVQFVLPGQPARSLKGYSTLSLSHALMVPAEIFLVNVGFFHYPVNVGSF
jgi:hypothetical protein